MTVGQLAHILFLRRMEPWGDSRQSAAVVLEIADSCSECSDLDWSVTGETEICGHLIQKKQIK